MHICVLGDLEDLASVYVGWLGRQGGCTVLELAEGTLGTAWDYDLDEGCVGTLRVGDTSVPWEAIAGVFVRLNPEPPLPPGVALAEPHKTMFTRERREGLHQLLDLLDCCVVNRPSAGRSNASKPYQMAELTAAGFDVPQWIVSNSAAAVRAFAGERPHGAIYKATSGLRSRVRLIDDQFMTRLEAGTTPTVVQEYVPGADVRVHTIGMTAFACQVTSAGVDYRFEHEGARYVATTVPDALAERCCQFAQAEGLVLAGFDFRVTADGRWRCLEMNPVPSFLPYEFSSGLPIGAAVVVSLVCGKPRSGIVLPSSLAARRAHR
jgi:hypothetical protein